MIYGQINNLDRVNKTIEQKKLTVADEGGAQGLVELMSHGVVGGHIRATVVVHVRSDSVAHLHFFNFRKTKWELWQTGTNQSTTFNELSPAGKVHRRKN